MDRRLCLVDGEIQIVFSVFYMIIVHNSSSTAEKDLLIFHYIIVVKKMFFECHLWAHDQGMD